MRIAIVHYHLGLGGVSHVIASASRCLTRMEIPHVILVDGEPDPEMAELPVKRVRGLGYLDTDVVGDADHLIKSLKEATKEVLGDVPDIWHFHNHSMGKNVFMAEIVAKLAEAGEKLVLQIHDLAEDGRYQNYAKISNRSRLYPLGDHIEYVFLNERDRKVFIANGVPEKSTRVAVNPVEPPKEELKKPEGAPIFFAPVRAIRRKNIGELVFLAAIAPAGTRLAISRAPTESGALFLYETWSKFAAYLRLPIGFDVVGRFNPADGASSDFASWVQHSTHFITTSVSESFGMTYLEAAAYDKPLLGRKISNVGAEHQKHGIKAGDLYDELLVPVEWVDLSILRQHFDTTIERNYRYLGRQLTRAITEESFAALVHDGWLDFGNLPEPIQQAVIERLMDTGCRNEPRVLIDGELRPAKEWLHEVVKKSKSSVTVEQLGVYSEQAYGKMLEELYEVLSKVKQVEFEEGEMKFLEPEAILSAYLEPKAFQFLTSVTPPRPATWSHYRAVIFDIYGTLLIAPPGGVSQPNPALDGLLQDVLDRHGFDPPESPTTALYEAVMRHHKESDYAHPEVDLRVVWREILKVPIHDDLTNLVVALESEARPSQPMPGAADFVRRLAHSGVSLGLLSNGQCNTLRSLGGVREFFAPELTILSYQQGMAKPSTELFQMMAERLAYRGIAPAETLFIGNDPLQDIVPAAAVGFKTALFTGHPESQRPGACTPDHEINEWPQTKGMRRC